MNYLWFGFYMAAKRPIRYATIDGDDSHWTGMFCISFVDEPAIEVDFVKLSKDGIKKAVNQTNIVKMHKFTEAGKTYVTGPLLIPDKLILRYDESKDELYDMVFTKEVIKETRDRFISRGYTSQFNMQHALPVNKTDLVEIWIIDDAAMDKAVKLGFDLPEGTLMGTARVTDPELIDQINTGKVKGFSIEGWYPQVDAELSATTNKNGDQPKVELPTRVSMNVFDKFRELFASKKTGKASLAIYQSGDTLINVDDQTGAANVLDADGNIGDPVSDGIFAVKVEEDGPETFLVIYGGSMVRNTASSAVATVELQLQVLVAGGTTREELEQSILDATGFTAEEWEIWMSNGGCVDLEKVTAIATAISLEVDTLKASFEVDGCSFEPAQEEVDAAATVIDMTKDAFMKANQKLMAQAIKDKKIGKVIAAKITPTEDQATKLGAVTVEDGVIVYISNHDGSAWNVDGNLWPTSYVPAGVYTLTDGRTITVIELSETYGEGTDYEWTYKWSVVDWAASELSVEDMLPWVKEQLQSLLTENPETTTLKAEVQKLSASANDTAIKLKEANGLIAERDAAITSLKAQVAKLAKEPAANPPADRRVIEKTAMSSTNREYHEKKVEMLYKNRQS